MLRADRRRRQRQWPLALSLRYTRCGSPLSPVPPLAIAPLGPSRNGRMACRGDLPAPDGHGLTADAVTVMVGTGGGQHCWSAAIGMDHRLRGLRIRTSAPPRVASHSRATSRPAANVPLPSTGYADEVHLHGHTPRDSRAAILAATSASRRHAGSREHHARRVRCVPPHGAAQERPVPSRSQRQRHTPSPPRHSLPCPRHPRAIAAAGHRTRPATPVSAAGRRG